ncbi:MAG: leucyl aminopeptidase [Alphaproteobacteria bacterium]|nr:leucyl aminopeptidase [Alphaproteobacteria bacterium]
MELAHTPAPVDSIGCDLLAIGVPDDGLAAALAPLGDAIAGDLVAAATAAEFSGKAGTIQVWPTLGRLAAPRIALVGLGDGSVDALRRAAGMVGSTARGRGDAHVVAVLGDLDHDATVAVVEGLAVGNYRYDRFKAEDARKAELEKVVLSGSFDEDGADLGLAIAYGQRLARDLVNGPAADVYPETLAETARQLAGDGLDVLVWDEARIKAEGMGGITAVGQGSDRPARFVHMSWTPAKARKKLVLVGKGVTFDAGGLSIKTSAGMQTMRCDMGGSAAVIGAMAAISRIAPDVEVHGIFGAVENMVSGNSYKLGDILSMYSGKTVEIHNTDAEGRLVLADCLAYGDALGADAMVDLATLTGAAVVALGSFYTGLFSHDDALADALLGAADDSGEGLWRMPFPEFYKDQLKGEWGTLKNVGGREGGAITAGLFLSEFVEKTPWAHLDIAGPAFFDKAFRHYAAGGTGAMVPSLVRWILS